MNRDKQDIYNKWHKELYQTDIDRSLLRLKKLHKAVFTSLGINEKTKGKLLDVACGKGLLLKEIRSFNAELELYGSDISDYAIKVARENVEGATFSVDDGESLSLKSNYFDYVTCLGGLEYYDNPPNGAKEIARVLKRSGVAILFVPNLMFFGYIWLAFRSGMMPTHGGSSGNKTFYDYNSEKFYTYQGWKDILEKGGLKIKRSLIYSHIGSTKFAKGPSLWLYNTFFYRFVPFHLGYSFIFVCVKK